MLTPPQIRVLSIAGTCPEAIKAAPVIQALAQDPIFSSRVLATAQHRHLLDQVLALFSIQPDLGLIQGDTTTVMTAALACFYRRIPFGQVEAGLGTGDLDNPFPEEMNRHVVGPLARWHFVPTESARKNLVREGLAPCDVFFTGNTVIDALVSKSGCQPEIGIPLDPATRLILVTAHRRENFGAPFREICQAIRQLEEANPDIQILYPVRPNPNIQCPSEEILGCTPRSPSAPLDYLPFVGAM